MLKEPLFFTPIFKERIWGGSNLKQSFGLDFSKKKIGECWGISTHPNGESIIDRGTFIKEKLSGLINRYPELFALEKDEDFPLLLKLIDAKKDLSIQVHPDDRKALELENYTQGKDECWYIVECKKDAEIVLGHSANSKEELSKLITLGAWDNLLKRIKVKPGDFYFIPSGTIHAIGKDIQILEIQQNSDITYRLFDFDRMDNGLKRDLHVNKALDVATVPDQHHPVIPKAIFKRSDITVTLYLSEFKHDIEKWKIKEFTKSINKINSCLLVFVLNGSGAIILENDKFSFDKGEFIIIPISIDNFKIHGTCELIVTHIKKKKPVLFEC